MTMQRISQVTAGADSVTPGRSAKTGDTTFETVMSKQAVNAVGASDRNTDTAFCSEHSGKSRELAANRYQKDKSVSTGNESVKRKEKDVEPDKTSWRETLTDEEGNSEVMAQTMTMLQDVYGLSESELKDIMEQLSITVQDMFLCNGEGSVISVNTPVIQELILGIHGIEDAAAFLTNDMLGQELMNVSERLTELLSEHLGENMEESVTNTTELFGMAEISDEQQKMTNTEDSSSGQTDNRLNAGDVQSVQQEETVSEAVQLQNESGDSEQQMNSRSSSHVAQDATLESHISSASDVFKDNLVQAFEEAHGEEISSAENVMSRIVEQVVHQVRVRVMPETTSMELWLNPASLGRVNLTVAATAGTATATLVVENQMAKEALESQMIQLKEAFVEQGLKVDAVEVTVAEFGLKKENEQQDDSSNGRRRNRRAHSEDMTLKEEESATDTVTAPERRSADSTVDYTA